MFFSERHVADLVAPNLTRVVPSYSDAELARAIRHGVRRDGTGLFAMPSASFYHLSDEDLARLLAFLRHQPRVDGDEQPTYIGPLGQLGIATGKFRLAPGDDGSRGARVAAVTRRRAGGAWPLPGDVVCSECHGPTLQGGLDGKAPPLAIAATYTDEAFRHLMKTGETPGKRALPDGGRGAAALLALHRRGDPRAAHVPAHVEVAAPL